MKIARKCRNGISALRFPPSVWMHLKVAFMIEVSMNIVARISIATKLGTITCRKAVNGIKIIAKAANITKTFLVYTAFISNMCWLWYLIDWSALMNVPKNKMAMVTIKIVLKIIWIFINATITDEYNKGITTSSSQNNNENPIEKHKMITTAVQICLCRTFIRCHNGSWIAMSLSHAMAVYNRRLEKLVTKTDTPVICAKAGK